MKEVTYEETLFDYSDAIINDEYTGFKQDYLILHSLIRKYKPKTFFEIGTNCGSGLNVICNAIRPAKSTELKLVYSLDLPTELAHISLQHPISEGKGDNVGSRCKFPYTQLRGDSLKFEFSKYPCQGYFIDGEHDYIHPYRESGQILLIGAKVVIWHDADILDVGKAINDVFVDNAIIRNNYDLFRVTGTRIACALRK